jgi:hypothetical protein
MSTGLRFVEEGITTACFTRRRQQYARAKRLRRCFRWVGNTAVMVALSALLVTLITTNIDRRVQALIGEDMCGGLEYVHLLLRHVPVLYLNHTTAVWFPSYATNRSSQKMRSIEQSIVCTTKASRLRHVSVTVTGPFTRARQLHGRVATCAAHRIDFHKHWNCSF